MIKFCKTECEPQKMLSRFGVNMNKMGAVYKDMLKVLFEVSSKNMQEEA